MAQELDQDLDRLPKNRRQWMIPALIGTASLVALVVIVAFVPGSTGSVVEAPQGPLLVEGGSELATVSAPADASEPLRVVLTDGSSIELDPGTLVEATANTGDRLALRMGPGRAIFDIAPDSPRTWSVYAGLASCDVSGSRLAVERGPSRVVVSMERGSAQVVSSLIEGGERRLDPGESITLEDHPDRSTSETPATGS